MSSVVHLHFPAPHIALIELADRANSNQFTHELVVGLAHALDQAQADPAIHVIVLHGVDNVFCTGGTRDELIGIVEQRIRFDDMPLYRLLLDCEIPVVAAMQGHALGGGLVMGLFADVIVLAEEAVYSANFMKYGFTPGMGATLILPEKFGSALAAEMLLTAGGYQGGELARRGVGVHVSRRKDVVALALRLAREIADKPRASLVLLKRHLTERIRAALPGTVAAERRMHETTFAGSEVRERIDTRFGT
ncbi:ptzG [Massilia sp. CCM 8695]|uniref:PtzG n=1 Tax=Massilia frigida TaxID=2609281 RepID=A0ABX0N7P6_9BURK|nr:polyketide synthase [Massilia frigida]NHZ81420.1 ptzG [Massilia frigida]